MVAKICKSCLNEVLFLKDGSHVFPRWLMLLTKEDLGCFSSIENGRVLTKQSDVKTQSWCSDCEKKFASLDGIGAKFFRDRGYLVEEKIAEHEGMLTLFELHSGERFLEVKLFIESLVIRHYLHHIEQGLPIREKERFERQLLSYRSGAPVYVRIANMIALKGSVMIGSENQDAISLLINGYWVQVYPSFSAYAPATEGVEDKLIPIAKVTSPYHPFYRMADRIFTAAKKNSVRPKRFEVRAL